MSSRTVVVLPAPFGPRRASTSPCCTSRVRPSRATPLDDRSGTTRRQPVGPDGAASTAHDGLSGRAVARCTEPSSRREPGHDHRPPPGRRRRAASPAATPPPTATCATRWPVCAAACVGLGLEPGDRVGIVAANNWYFVVVVPGRPRRRARGRAAQPDQPAPRASSGELAAIGAARRDRRASRASGRRRRRPRRASRPSST